MKLIEAYAKLRTLGLMILKTNDVATFLNIELSHASQILIRLSRAKQMIQLARGLWAFPEVDILTIPEYITAPFPSYISLQTALYYHGMISQIPEKIYVVSLARTRLMKTPISTISIHHIQPDFFFGYENRERSHIKLATPEKALLDFLYLSNTQTKLFHSLPEIELPTHFKIQVARNMIRKISSKQKKDFLLRKLDQIYLNKK